jgi:hypothetical protein
MGTLKSVTGAALAALYALAFVVAYVDYRDHAGQWLADIWLILVALPFVLTMRTLTGGFALTGDDTGKLLLAAAFCCTLAFAFGAALEALIRTLIRGIRRAAAPRGPSGS